MALLRRALLAVLLLRVALGGQASASRDRDGAGRFDPTRVAHVSWHPRAFLHKGFLSDAECDHLALVRYDTMVESGSCVIIENGEPIQVLRYKNGEKYEPHFDYFNDKHNQLIGGQRIATVLMYLSHVKMGGETIFPDSEDQLTQEKDDTWPECATLGYAVKPVKGDALLFFSLHPNATTDTKSLHGSCPVIEGEKWSARNGSMCDPCPSVSRRQGRAIAKTKIYVPKVGCGRRVREEPGVHGGYQSLAWFLPEEL
ncbi:hypothetical protein C2845_PM02G36500 [Panicum miliaceum]|uniref:Fe2OG dioxygenase domain-containing protein n=1 Tax=Panicum miliaceum TaxID=4540 RepID=A0A3L6S7V5_PANMI|nr:hypothetical protein C2845_PM02G36500 [Panicum miliaceum]